MTFGERIVAARKEKGITQKDLAAQLGIGPTRLNYWEKDKRFPPIPMLNKIAELLDVDSDYLIGRVGDLERKENSPVTAAAETGEVDADQIKDLLVELGIMPDNIDLTEHDLRFLTVTFKAIADWFAQRSKDL